MKAKSLLSNIYKLFVPLMYTTLFATLDLA